MFDGQVVLVTGAGSGIGAAAAAGFSAQGAKLVLCDIKLDAVQEVAARIGGGAIAIAADVADTQSVAGMIAQIEQRFGRLDVAVNNAGIGGSGKMLADIPEAHFDRLIGINLKGVWQCMRHEIPLMLKNGGGAIVNTASALGLIGWLGTAEYIAAKHGVIGLTKAGSAEYSSQGIRVNAVCPGVIDTPLVRSNAADPVKGPQLVALHPIGRLGQPGEVADAILWLASNHASFVTGAAIAVDGGWTSV